MRIQALKTLLDGNVTTRKGAVVEMDNWKARELIALGYAVHLPEPKESVAAPLVGKDSVDFPRLQAGSRDGLEKPALSSQAAPARPKRTYKQRAAKPKS